MLALLLRNDFRLLGTHVYEQQEPMNVDVVAFRGISDTSVTEADVQKWAGEISGNFTMIEREGDHHYLREDAEYVSGVVRDQIKKQVMASVA